MKLKTKYLSCLICILTLYISSCNKEKKQIIDIDDELKKYFNYQPGTYWVYYDSVNHVEDSFWVNRNYQYKYNEGAREPDYIAYAIEILTNRVFDTPYNKYGTIAGIGLRGITFSFGVNFPLTGNNTNPAFRTNTPLLPNSHDVVINNYRFNEIIGLKNYNYSHIKDSIFLNKNVGIVKIISNSTNRNYNLVRWKIVK